MLSKIKNRAKLRLSADKKINVTNTRLGTVNPIVLNNFLTDSRLNFLLLMILSLKTPETTMANQQPK